MPVATTLEELRAEIAIETIKTASERMQELKQPLIPKERISALKKRVLSNIREFCYYLYPKGRLSSKGGYWEVPAPDLIKISFKTGKFFDWNLPACSKSMEDLITLWMITKKQENFKRAVIELEH
jgi:hypothetical protein